MVYNLGLYIVLTQCAAIFYAVSKPRTGKSIIRSKEDITEAIQCGSFAAPIHLPVHSQAFQKK